LLATCQLLQFSSQAPSQASFQLEFACAKI